MRTNLLNPLLLAKKQCEIKKLPNAIAIEVSTLCHLQCAYCKHERGMGENISKNKFMQLKLQLDKIEGLERIVFCGIGESFLNKEIYEMIHCLRKYKISVVTSGTILIDYKELLANDNVDILIFSIDATSEELVKSICGEIYSYKNLMENIKTLTNSIKSKRAKINTVLNCTVNESNIGEIPLLVDFAFKNGFSSIHYSISWGSFDLVEENWCTLKNNFSEASEKARKLGIMYFDPIKFFCCINGDNVLPFININGDIFPCGFGISKQYVVGNIFENDFREIWEFERYKNFNCGGLCEGCCLIEMFDFVKGRCH